MQVTDEERYIFYLFAISDISQAAIALDKGNETDDQFVKGSLYALAVIAYRRPFTKTKISDAKAFSLPVSFVPRDQRKLHDQLLLWRNKMLAHTVELGCH